MKNLYVMGALLISITCYPNQVVRELFRDLVRQKPILQSFVSKTQQLKLIRRHTDKRPQRKLLLRECKLVNEVHKINRFVVDLDSRHVGRAQSMPYFHAAQTDLNLLSRFLKELAKHPCVLLSPPIANFAVAKELFPQAVSCEAGADSWQNYSWEKLAQNFIDAHPGYCVVLTNLGPMSLMLQHKIWQKNPHVCLLAVDDLISAINDDRFSIDIPKLLRLMKRRIHIVCTAALIPMKYERRKNQYIRSFNRLIEFGYHPYIVEPCEQGPTFLEDYSKHLFYSRSNDLSLKNKGINESVSILKAFNAWDFDEHDIIIKLTGRYFFLSDAFIRLLEDNEELMGAAKFEPFYNIDAALTGCFALRFDLFKEMLASFDYEKMEKESICIEHEVGPYMNTLAARGFNIARVEVLRVEANMFYTLGSEAISYW